VFYWHSVCQKHERRGLLSISATALLGKIVTGDKTWVFQYDPETKHQNPQWKDPQYLSRRKSADVKSDVRAAFVCLLESKAFASIYYDFFRPKRTVNQTFQRQVVERSWQLIHQKRNQIFGRTSVFCIMKMRLHSQNFRSGQHIPVFGTCTALDWFESMWHFHITVIGKGRCKAKGKVAPAL
jgi:hypothetical protein